MRHIPSPLLQTGKSFTVPISSILSRLADAQRAISTERRKLLKSARDISNVAQERQVLDNALFSLQALARCMAIPTTALACAIPEVRVA